MIDQHTVKSLFYYDANSGMLFWRNGNGRNVKPWQQAKSQNGHGYCTVKINNQSHLVHRLIWLYAHGYMPQGDLDHKNRIRNDNRLSNLREVTRSDNCQNISLPKHNTSGHIGISWYARDQKWNVYIKVNKKNKWLGRYSSIDDAIEVRKKAEQAHYNLPN